MQGPLDTRMLQTVALQSFEALNQRAVAVVVDPVQSVKGKVRKAGLVVALLAKAQAGCMSYLV
jgi:hypothetical protein